MMTHDNKNIHKMVRQVNGCHDYAPIGLSSFGLRAKRAEFFWHLYTGEKLFRVVNHTREGANLWPKGGGPPGPWPGGPPLLRHCCCTFQITQSLFYCMPGCFRMACHCVWSSGSRLPLKLERDLTE